LLAGRNLSLNGDAALRLLDGVVHFLLLHGSAGLKAVDRALQALDLFGGDCPARELPSQDVICRWRLHGCGFQRYGYI
ncbi:MAG: hypothetical protein KGI52_14555, partial [Burkholderiales bacterium]|nr:hypothetical protein [Burkholderiales bacterium]